VEEKEAPARSPVATVVVLASDLVVNRFVFFRLDVVGIKEVSSRKDTRANKDERKFSGHSGHGMISMGLDESQLAILFLSDNSKHC
jgi:hypothetical protein